MRTLISSFIGTLLLFASIALWGNLTVDHWVIVPAVSAVVAGYSALVSLALPLTWKGWLDDMS